MSLRALTSDVAFYGALDFLQRSIGLLMVPLYTRFLSQADYGQLDMLLILCAMFMVIVDLQFGAAFSRMYLEHREAGAGRRFVGTVLLVRVVGGVVMAVGTFAAGRLGYVEWSFAPSFSAHTVAWTWLLVLVPLSLVFDILLLQTRMLRLKRAFAAGVLWTTGTSALVSILLVVVWSFGMAGVIAGLVAGKFVGVCLLLWQLRHEIALHVDRAILRPLLQYSLPLIPGWWLSFGAGYLGRFFIYGSHGPDANAVLAVTMKVASLIALFSVSFRAAWHPMAMSYIGTAEGPLFYVRSLRLFMAGGFGSALALAVALPVVLAVLVPGPYAVVEVYFPLFAVAMLVGECESNLQLGNQIAKRTHWISISSAIYLAVNAIVLIALVERLGVAAAGLALVLACTVKLFVTYTTGQRNWPIPYDVRALGVFGAGCFAFLVLGFCQTLPSVPGWTVRVGLVVLAVLVPWLILDGAERRAMAGMARHAFAVRVG